MAFQQRGREPGFPDPGLSGDQDGLAFTCLGPGPALQQQLGLLLAPDEGCKAGRVQRLQTAFHETGPQRRPRPHRPRRRADSRHEQVLDEG
jgi:hypothetical protein